MTVQHHIPLRQILDEREVSAKALARAVDTDASTVSRWRSGVRPSQHFRDLLCKELSLTDAEVVALGWDTEPTNV